MNGGCEDPLEASWASLQLFNQTQCGRICGGSTSSLSAQASPHWRVPGDELARALTLEEDASHEDGAEEPADFIIPELPEGFPFPSPRSLQSVS